VAQGAAPDAVFASVAEEVGTLLRANAAAVTRFDLAATQATLVGPWTRPGETLAQEAFGLDGGSAAAAVFRSRAPSRVDVGNAQAVAVPIIVAGELWGALGASFAAQHMPAGAEPRLERFGHLVGLAISNAEAWERLDHHASTDALTGIANRRVFDDRLRAELAIAQRHERAVSLALFDLDHFKRVNDVYGHQSGDRALVRFASLLSEHARLGDVVARVGGEEFAWLMPETDVDGAFAAAERLRTAIELERDDEFGAITMSAGVVIADSLSTATSLVQAADRALYQAKESGRNRTVVRAATVA
jgi:diguanylate cyclase (GGDEF)-like protein